MSDTKPIKAMNYDGQLIVCLVPGGRDASKGNRIAYMNAEALEAKRRLVSKITAENFRTRLIKADCSGTPDLSAHRSFITSNTRVYLVGHGRAEFNHFGWAQCYEFGGDGQISSGAWKKN